MTNGLLVALLILMTASSLQLIRHLQNHQLLVGELAELRHVRYGMLNANQWVNQLSGIVEQRIRDIELEGEQRAAAKAALERILDTLLTEADHYIRQQHTTGDWWDRTTGKLKESMRNRLMDIETIKAGIPQYADEILDELENDETRQSINHFLNRLVNDVAESTFGEVDDTLRDRIRARHGCEGSITECKSVIRDRLRVVDGRARVIALLTVLCSVLMLALVARDRNDANRLKWLLLSGAALLLLMCGILTPMLEVEAQIQHLRFVLLEQDVEFFNEVLYFQSKSIFDVVSILVAKREFLLVGVGVLLVTFSVIFPALKLAASALYVYRPDGLGRHALVEFFALKSAKWSMADVMVIAIMMSYIGFDGIINAELDQVTASASAAGLNMISTNGTALQPGFYMFLAFCLYGLVLSSLLESRLAAHADSPGAHRAHTPVA